MDIIEKLSIKYLKFKEHHRFKKLQNIINSKPHQPSDEDIEHLNNLYPSMKVELKKQLSELRKLFKEEN